MVVMGEGLNGAFAGQAANFMIDASNAGEGDDCCFVDIHFWLL